jgi:hypothetical protein
MKKNKILYSIPLILVIYLMLTNAIFQFSNPSITTTEAFLHLPKTLILDFTK